MIYLNNDFFKHFFATQYLNAFVFGFQYTMQSPHSNLTMHGKELSQKIIQDLKDTIPTQSELYGLSPGLAIILVGTRSDSEVYVRMKQKRCQAVGIHNIDFRFPETTSEQEILTLIESLNTDANIHGILVQLPLPSHINEETVLKSIDKHKDVDGLHPENIGNLALNRVKNTLVSCTPKGCMELLRRNNIPIAGKHAVIIGRSNIVGLPLSLMLLHAHATTTICHSRTPNLKDIVLQGDIVVAAVGKPLFLTKEYFKKGAVIIDVGINRVPCSTRKSGYKLVGDVDYEGVKDQADYITPVPGGVGPMTIAMLLTNTVQAFHQQLSVNQV